MGQLLSLEERKKRRSKSRRLEGSRTNLLLRSNEPTTSPWVAVLTPNVALQIVGDEYGFEFQLEDDNATGYEGYQQIITVPDDTTSYTASVFIKKNTSWDAVPGYNFQLTGGSTVSQNIRLNMDTGAASTGGSVIDYGDFWRVYSTITNNASGNTNLVFSIYPATRETFAGGDNAASQGTNTFKGFMVSRGSTPPYEYIPTGATAVDPE